MSVLTILLILFGIFAFAIFFKLIKSVVKAAFFVLGLFAVFLVIIGVVVMIDANNFKKGFQEGTTKYVLVDGESVLASVIVDGQDAEITQVSPSQFATDLEAYPPEDYEAIKGDHFKVFFIDKIVLENLSDSLMFGDYRLPQEQAIAILESPDAIGSLAEAISAQEGMPVDQARTQLDGFYETPEEAKGSILALFLAELFPARITYVIESMRQGTIQVYEETILFKSLQHIPLGIIERSAAKLQAPEEEA